MPKKKNKEEDIVFIPKLGKEKEFEEAIAFMDRSKGIGWKEHAEMQYDLGVHDFLGFELEGETKVEQIKCLENILKQIALNNFLEVAEQVTEEEAKRRKLAVKTLYGKQ